MNKVKLLHWLALAFALAGCAAPADDQRIENAERIAVQGGLAAMPVSAQLPVKVWGRLAPAGAVHIYIEGDGAAWRNSRQPSLDPTPHNPVALKLAAADKHASVLYLGRPCQYDADATRGCHFREWTERRFAHANELEQVIRQKVPAERELVLIGFSGGANLAVQLAAKLLGVTGLITVAGNLDAAVFTHYHRLRDEAFGHNAALLSGLSELPQLHYTGIDDAVVPPELTRLQLAPISGSQCLQVRELTGLGHAGPWHIDWPAFTALQQRCRP